MTISDHARPHRRLAVRPAHRLESCECLAPGRRPDFVNRAHPRIVGPSSGRTRRRFEMAVKLHRCSGMWAKFGGHPCWRVQKALDETGVEYELVQVGSAFKGSSRGPTIEETGQKKFTWIELEYGMVYRVE